jgi:hypothetical protein
VLALMEAAVEPFVTFSGRGEGEGARLSSMEDHRLDRGEEGGFGPVFDESDMLALHAQSATERLCEE